jgi:hypothetical protein
MGKSQYHLLVGSLMGERIMLHPSLSKRMVVVMRKR